MILSRSLSQRPRLLILIHDNATGRPVGRRPWTRQSNLSNVRFWVTDALSVQIPEDKTTDVQNSSDEVKSEKDLINQFMEQMLDRLEGVEATVDEQHLRSLYSAIAWNAWSGS
ncbi:Activity-regulated cytoskeleton-associated protein [Aphis craccivora]|uniref:Activity-regulated cytoskeleton-associated protein n=1 Tax=Aphis craccivora TaxID=307492 RepID=A0A6G0Y9K5_APHCR|nr:Activity-regulated cytoskeleton-associated protein [Aphis craccivora]